MTGQSRLIRITSRKSTSVEQIDTEDWANDVLARRRREERRWYAIQPKRLDNVFAQVIQVRGYGRIETDTQLGTIWSAIVGEMLAGVSRACQVRRGRLLVIAANSAALQELTFRKQEILREFGRKLPEARIENVVFRVGPLGR
jgi:hypothetical protein